MSFNKLKNYFYPQELLAVPFLILVIVLYKYFGLPFNLHIRFAFWLITIAVAYSSIFLAVVIFKNGFLLRNDVEVFSKIRLFEVLVFFRNWLSILVILLVYENLQIIVPYLNSNDKDTVLLAIDRWLFGYPHITVIFQQIISPRLTEWMSFAYLTFFFYLPLLGSVLYFKNNLKAIRILFLAITITSFTGFILYALVPAVGPYLAFPSMYSVDLQGKEVGTFTQNFINGLGVSRNTFPSLHTAMSVIYFVVAFKYARRWFYFLAPVIISLWISTLYLRYHYLIDLVAGVALAFLALWLSKRINIWWYHEK